MDHLISFPLAGGDCVVVQLEARPNAGPAPAGNQGKLLQQAQVGFEEAASRLRPIARTLLDQIKDLGPQEVKLELSVRFSAELGMVVAKSTGEGHCRLEMTWKTPG